MTSCAATYDDLLIKIGEEFNFRRLEDRVQFAAFTESLCKYAELTKDAQLAALGRMLRGLWQRTGYRLAGRGSESLLGRAGMRMAGIPSARTMAGLEARTVFNPLARTVSAAPRVAGGRAGQIVMPNSAPFVVPGMTPFGKLPLLPIEAMEPAAAAASRAAGLQGMLSADLRALGMAPESVQVIMPKLMQANPGVMAQLRGRFPRLSDLPSTTFARSAPGPRVTVGTPGTNPFEATLPSMLPGAPAPMPAGVSSLPMPQPLPRPLLGADMTNPGGLYPVPVPA